MERVGPSCFAQTIPSRNQCPLCSTSTGTISTSLLWYPEHMLCCIMAIMGGKVIITKTAARRAFMDCVADAGCSRKSCRDFVLFAELKLACPCDWYAHYLRFSNMCLLNVAGSHVCPPNRLPFPELLHPGEKHRNLRICSTCSPKPCSQYTKTRATQFSTSHSCPLWGS